MEIQRILYDIAGDHGANVDNEAAVHMVRRRGGKRNAASTGGGKRRRERVPVSFEGRPTSIEGSGSPLAQHVRPDLRQFAAASHVSGAIIGALNLFLWDVGKHPVDDLAIMILTLSLGPFVHDRREGRAEAMRNMVTVIAGAIEQIADCILAHRSMRMPVARKKELTAQRKALGGAFDKEFVDEGVSGAILAADRPGFAALLSYIREGDTLCIAAIDRLGRDALDIQSTVRNLLNKGVTVDVFGLGPIGKGVGELIVAVLAQLADLERNRIIERCDAGRAAARIALSATGKTHRGKISLGRPFAADAAQVRAWRKQHGASIAVTAKQFSLSAATVKRYCAL